MPDTFQNYDVTYSYTNTSSQIISVNVVFNVDITTNTVQSVVGTGTYKVGSTTYNITGLAATSVDNSDNYFNASQPAKVDQAGVTFITNDLNADGIISSGTTPSPDVTIFNGSSSQLAARSDFEDNPASTNSTAFTITASTVCYASGTLTAP